MLYETHQPIPPCSTYDSLSVYSSEDAIAGACVYLFPGSSLHTYTLNIRATHIAT